MDGTKKDPDEIYISVDIECSGPDRPGYFSMLSIGACVVKNRSERFYVELCPLNGNYDADALGVCGLDFVRLREVGVPPQEAIEGFDSWVKKVSGKKKPVFTAFFAPFDWMFIDWYMKTFLGENIFAIAALDMKAYYMGMTGKSWQDSSKGRLEAKFRSDLPHTHNALDDALEQADVFEKMLEYQEKRRMNGVSDGG